MISCPGALIPGLKDIGDILYYPRHRVALPLLAIINASLDQTMKWINGRDTR
ncbi:MAG: hypothetical protein WB791_07095 [Waddliaceae bacterium]